MIKPHDDKESDVAFFFLNMLNLLCVGVYTWQLFQKPDLDENFYEIVQRVAVFFGCLTCLLLIIATGMRVQNIFLIYIYALVVLFGMMADYSEGYDLTEYDNVTWAWSRYVINLGIMSMVFALLYLTLGQTEDYDRYVVKWK